MKVFFGSVFSVLFLTLLLKFIDFSNQKDHFSQSEAEFSTDNEISKQPKIEQLALFDYTHNNGQKITYLINEKGLTDFVKNKNDHLITKSIEQKEKYKHKLNKNFTEVIQEINGKNIELFADWYFSYKNSYEIIFRGLTAYITEDASDSKSRMDNATEAVEKYLKDNYLKIVLNPENYGNIFFRLFKESAIESQNEYIKTIHDTDDELLKILKNETTHTDKDETKMLLKTINWNHQLDKVNFDNKGSFDSLIKASMISSGYILGKAPATVFLKTGIGKILSTSAFKGFITKLSTPLVSKIATGTVTALTASLTGPVGTIVGIATGLTIDYMLNKTDEKINRADFINKARSQTEVISNDLMKAYENELETYIDRLYEDGINIYIKNN